MARRKKGRDISGWLVVDKPAGITSTAVVNKLRWALDAKKAGHAGTLDPDATGLLAVALGEATKTIPFITDALKAYDFTVKWGEATTTDDASGQVIASADARPDEPAIKSALLGFIGDIQQVPPAFSAVKVDGARAYDLARDGDRPELEPRPLWVEDLVLTDAGPDTARFEMTCGKGGYVRSIARDLGQVLGCYGHVVTLRRIWSGPFDLTGSVTLEQIDALAKTPELDALLRPLQDGLDGLPMVTVPEMSLPRLRNGNDAPVIGAADYGETVWASHQGTPVAVGTYRGGTFQPTRVFNL